MTINTNTEFTYIEKLEIYSNIKLLNEIQQNEIYNLIKLRGINFTQNNNGIFINFTNLTDAILIEMRNYINYIKQNEERLREHEEEIENQIQMRETNISKQNVKVINEFKNISVEDMKKLGELYENYYWDKDINSMHTKFINCSKKYNRIIYNYNPNPDALNNNILYEDYIKN